MSRNTAVRLLIAFALGAIVVVGADHVGGTASYAVDIKSDSDDIAALKAEIDHLKGLVPDQSHAMTDVAMHYSNLWFAGQAENWPLAQFFFDETRSHIRWAIRIIPVRKGVGGQQLPLGPVFDAMDATNMKTLGQTIAAKDKPKFEAAYREMLDSCYACHLGADKPYLTLKVPDRPALPVIDFAPRK